MSPKRANKPIQSWEEGDQVTGFALLMRKEARQDRNGRTFLDLELVDASGSITGKVWADSSALSGDYEAHQFVAFRGSVKSYRDQLQLTVQECRQIEDGDRERGFDEAKLIPSSETSVDDLWRQLEEIYPQAIERPVLRRLIEESLVMHGEALREHPAAKGIHHAYRGGLLEHLVSMAQLALHIGNHYSYLDRDLLLVGVFFHDLGKTVEIGPMPVNDYTLKGRLVGHIVIGRDLLRDRCAAIPEFPEDLQLHLEHLVLSHQGRLDFASPVVPMTAEAFVLHALDDLDSKLNQLQKARQGQTDLAWIAPLGRYVYLPGAAPGIEPEERGSSAEEPSDDDPMTDTQPRLDL